MPDQPTFHLPGYQLPTSTYIFGQAEGFLTPQEDRLHQVVCIPPKRVLPIIFLPGIMGSNLRMSATRQKLLRKTNNIAWRPDSLTEAVALSHSTAGQRQRQLDPTQTEVDIYDPVTNPTGDPQETADQRHDNAEVAFKLNVGIDTPLLMDDPVTYKRRRTKEQKARERGWGEVFFGSYRNLLEMCELRLNSAFRYGKLDDWWRQIVNVAPSQWQACAQTPLPALTEAELKNTVKGCWFPVHAMGYNWLESNKQSGINTAERIEALIKRYQEQGYDCEKVIIVTHSMGGLVARALIHPDMGNLQDKVLGIVHGVMPATGAAAAYKRMRCGFEDPGLMSLSPINSITAKVLGNMGAEVTAVLGNAPGGLELLPSLAYGKEWLHIKHKGQIRLSLPKNGDPYDEIYPLKDKWYGLLRAEWITPKEGLKDLPMSNVSLENTLNLIKKAKAFHQAIADTYHPNSYAHYGAGMAHAAWHHVVWEIDEQADVNNIDDLRIVEDTQQGQLILRPTQAARPGETGKQSNIKVTLLPPTDPGDQTVPLHSAEHQLLSGKFKGIFRQTGYEHQKSYDDARALHSTLYCLVRIAHTMTWSQHDTCKKT